MSILIIEPFYGGSHKQLVDLLVNEFNSLELNYDLYTLPAKKWHWRARCSALHFSQIIKRDKEFKILLASSVLNLSELVSLRSDLASAFKIIYFHENQLVYPVRENKERDFQFGYNQILTSLVCDKIIFNSDYNKTSFLNSINSFLKLIPDHCPRINIHNTLANKSQVLYFPIDLKLEFIERICVSSCLSQMLVYLDLNAYTNRPLHILWSHRWEHDKNPQLFFKTLFKLKELQIDFRVSIIGETFQDVPEIFNEAKEKLSSLILNYGYAQSKEDYYEILSKSDIIISTSNHEFFGVSVMEACLLGVYPLLPNRLVYPELYPKECLYSTDAQLLKRLKYFCKNPMVFRKSTKQAFFSQFSTEKYLWSSLRSSYIELFE